MTTYRLTPVQMTQLAFALGAAAATESGSEGDYIRLANKVSQSCALGSSGVIIGGGTCNLSCNHQETGRLSSAIERAISALNRAGTEPGEWLRELDQTIRTTATEQQTVGATGG
jgi:hypothetical protein